MSMLCDGSELLRSAELGMELSMLLSFFHHYCNQQKVKRTQIPVYNLMGDRAARLQEVPMIFSYFALLPVMQNMKISWAIPGKG